MWFNINIIANYVALFSSGLVAWVSLASKLKSYARIFLSFFSSSFSVIWILFLWLLLDHISLAMKELLTLLFFKVMHMACVLPCYDACDWSKDWCECQLKFFHPLTIVTFKILRLLKIIIFCFKSHLRRKTFWCVLNQK